MDLFILLGTGLLGAMFLASQSNSGLTAPLWKFALGGTGGALAYVALSAFGQISTNNTIGSFILLFVLGSFSGGLLMLIFIMIRAKMSDS